MAATTKIYTQDSIRRRKMLLPLMLVLLLIVVPFLQKTIDPTAEEYHKGEKSLVTAGMGLNNEFLLLPMLGFREAAAGLLWVRCDEFFHSGDYDAILPLVRLITWLDPHADNVYVTGAWHLSYNFTDSSERSDRRYIPPAMRLLDEGIQNNMNIPDIKFEKGWQLYDKVKDFNGAEDAFKLALATKPSKNSDDYPYGAPLRIWHTLAHAYEKQGRIPEALATWQKAMQRAHEMLGRNPKDYSTKQLLAAEKHNYELTLQRYQDRYQTSGHDHTNPTPYPAVLMPAAGSKTLGPWDGSFEPHVEITRPKVFKVSGRFAVADGARVDVRIEDEDYKPIDVSNARDAFNIPLDQTILVDTVSVRKTRFEREMDMSRDAKMYSFSKPYLKVILSYNPRTTSPHLQDRFGWSGEGLTDRNPNYVYYDKRPELLGTKLIEGQQGDGPKWDGKDETWRQGGRRPEGSTEEWKPGGQPPRLIKVTYRVKAEDVLNGGKVLTDKDIVPND
ncbi:MAG TPA: tetratricopeptide repeat protein [Chthonomonadaceae bacterium]|nr:tetratricopeptide repeat protein [Chthonomonadaceae bacterium]